MVIYLEMLKEPEETLCLSSEVSMALISICARPAPNMGGPAVISIHAWTQTRALQTVL